MSSNAEPSYTYSGHNPEQDIQQSQLLCSPHNGDQSGNIAGHLHIDGSLLSGKWKLVNLYMNVVGVGWVLCKEYEANEVVWEFSRTGMFTEWIKEKECSSCRFFFHEHNKQVTIERPNSTARKQPLYINRISKIEPENHSKIWLYDLEHLHHEPDGYQFRMECIRL